MAKKKQQKQEEQPLKLIRIYKDVVGRIIRVFKNPSTRQYTIDSRLYSRDGQAIALLTFTFKDRKSCFNELKRYPAEKREELK